MTLPFQIECPRNAADIVGTMSGVHIKGARLMAGTVAVGDGIQIGNVLPPVAGTVTNLDEHQSHGRIAPVPQVTCQGWAKPQLDVTISGMSSASVPPKATLMAVIAAPGNAQPTANVPATSPFPVQPLTDITSEMEARMADMLGRLGGKGANSSTKKTVTIRSTAASGPGEWHMAAQAGEHVTSWQTTESEHGETLVINGQPVTEYTQQVADIIGPIITSAGPNPSAVTQVLHDRAAIGEAAAESIVASAPGRLPILSKGPMGMDEDQINGLVDALRAAGATILIPAPNSPARLFTDLG